MDTDNVFFHRSISGITSLKLEFNHEESEYGSNVINKSNLLGGHYI